MTAARAAPAGHPCGGAAGGAHHPAGGAQQVRRGQRVRVPWRIVASPWFTDGALAVYIKIAALAQRGAEGCTAKVICLAEYLGMSKSAVERALRLLTQADEEGVTEVCTRRETLPDGTGTSARRWPRPMAGREPWVWLPVAAADALPPRLLRAYAALAYATARGLPVTEAELGETTGRSERSGSRALDALAAAGWISLERRAGYRGRHLVTAHRHPLHPVPTPDTSDGSGGDSSDGSLASKEDHQTDRPDQPPRSSPSAVGEVREVGVDNPPPATFRGPSAGGRPLAYGGPPLQLSPRIWDVLAPVRHLLPGLTPYVVRRAARDIAAQLDSGTEADRIRYRLQLRCARTDVIRDPGRWLLGAGLPRWGCGLADCEAGLLWSTGRRCQVCADLAADRRTGHPPHPPPPRTPPPQWHECAHCRAPSRTRHRHDGLCATCRAA